MAPTARHHLHDVPLGRRMLRFVLLSIFIVTAVLLVQMIVTYVAMPKSAKASHHARAACGLFVDWIEADGAAGSPAAAGTLRKATESARSAASVAPERWSVLLKDFQAAASPIEEVVAAGPGIARPRDEAISEALGTCDPLVGKTSGS